MLLKGRGAMYHGYFEGYVRDDDGRCVHFEVKCEKVRREDCLLIHNALSRSPDITVCMASITEPQEVKEIFCDTCGSQLVFKTAAGAIASSDYIGTSTCRVCQREHCRTTNCLKCETGKYPDCQFPGLKRPALEKEFNNTGNNSE